VAIKENTPQFNASSGKCPYHGSNKSQVIEEKLNLDFDMGSDSP
jgi:hypothetical protein